MKFVKSKSNRWEDLSGKVYNKLTVLGYIGEGRWWCLCDCGNRKAISTCNLKDGSTKSCGCLAKTNAVSHGKSSTSEYHSWSNIKARCTNPKNNAYHNYGGRGITMCPEWRNSFEQFLADMGPCPKGYSIDRIDNNGNYEATNCRWANPTEQANNKRNNTIVEFNGQKKPLKQMCEDLGLGYKKIFARIKILGWSIEESLTRK